MSGSLTADAVALIRASLEQPQDYLSRLALCDWLQERNDPRGDVLRLAVELMVMPARQRGDVPIGTAPDARCPFWKNDCERGVPPGRNCQEVGCKKHRSLRHFWPALPKLGKGLQWPERAGPGPVPRRAGRLLACVYLARVLREVWRKGQLARYLLAACGVVGEKTRDEWPKGKYRDNTPAMKACRAGGRNAHLSVANHSRWQTLLESRQVAWTPPEEVVRLDALKWSLYLDVAERFDRDYPWGRVKELCGLAPLVP